MSRLGQADLFENPRHQPCGKNTSPCVMGQINLSTGPIIVSKEKVEIRFRSNFYQVHGMSILAVVWFVHVILRALLLSGWFQVGVRSVLYSVVTSMKVSHRTLSIIKIR